MRVGLFGGSFNPPHQGHLHISKLATKKLGLNQIWWIPTAHNPFKDPAIYESYETRIEKCRKFADKSPKILVKNFDEIRTVKLVNQLQKRFPNHQFFWIMGADNFGKFHQWDDFTKLIKMLPIVVFSREKYLLKIRQTKAFQIYKKISNSHGLPKFEIFPTQNLNISSTEIRKNAKLYS